MRLKDKVLGSPEPIGSSTVFTLSGVKAKKRKVHLGKIENQGEFFFLIFFCTSLFFALLQGGWRVTAGDCCWIAIFPGYSPGVPSWPTPGSHLHPNYSKELTPWSFPLENRTTVSPPRHLWWLLSPQAPNRMPSKCPHLHCHWRARAYLAQHQFFTFAEARRSAGSQDCLFFFFPCNRLSLFGKVVHTHTGAQAISREKVPHNCFLKNFMN